ncbi:hypothetical protein D9611_009950 [Ephemerocybe angulata]|uniref:Uncharacterized protein n=1 Tax=Ephemerocybe angulata TaxID=980116 RepID=A0A8H5FF90_9AGAR|nr:hypothetical protein D9611_009950 [Tulosesus angulatus]
MSNKMSNLTTSSPPAGEPDGVSIISSKGRVCRNRFDAALDDLPLDDFPVDCDFSSNFLPNDEALNALYRGMGTPESDLAAARADWDRRMDSLLDVTGGKILYEGAKPNPGDNVWLVPIPDDRLSIRFWDGGDEEEREFFFDYVDLCEKKAVNSPAGYEVEAYFNLRHHLAPGEVGPIHSNEAWAGFSRSDIREGRERFTALACNPCVLHRPGKEDFFFTVPDYPEEVSPVPGVKPGVHFATAGTATW